jgi:hypothetical protein
MGFPGWQGIVPFKAVAMTAMATDIILERLVDMKVELGKVDPDIVASLLETAVVRPFVV